MKRELRNAIVSIAVLMALTGCTPIWEKWDVVARHSDLFEQFVSLLVIVMIQIFIVYKTMSHVDRANTTRAEEMTSRLDELERRIQSLECKD